MNKLSIAAFAAFLLLPFEAYAQGPLDFIQANSVQTISAKPRRGILKPQVGETNRRVTTTLPPPPPFIRGKLVCALNVNKYRAKLGLATTNSAAAKSFLQLRRIAQPIPGAVQVETRKGGGHVKIYAGDGMCWNPSYSRQMWRHTKCGTRNLVGFVT